MAIGLRNRDYNTQVCQFVVDNKSEISLLPDLLTSGKVDYLKHIYSCAMGSTAIITEDDSIYYILTGENKWVKKTVPSGGSGGESGGGGSTGGDEFVDEDDIDNLFP